MTLREFDRVLAEEDVEEIDPETGSEVDPQRHTVMARVDSAKPEGTIAEVFTPGYEMSEKVIQHAQVTVSNGEDSDTTEEDTVEAEEPKEEAETTEADPAADSDDDEAAIDGEETSEEDANPAGSNDDAIAMGGDVEGESVDESAEPGEGCPRRRTAMVRVRTRTRSNLAGTSRG
ncbi:MAG: nucleotide exchange factor GrpE [Natrialbaceae archaeon]|nr:nucleotide exchange factor GrpE [Natrialbaceae archaeon]